MNSRDNPARRSVVAMVICGCIFGPAFIIGGPIIAAITWNHSFGGYAEDHPTVVVVTVIACLIGVGITVLGFIKYPPPPARLRRRRRWRRPR